MMLYRVAKDPDSWLGMAVFLFLGRAGDGVLIGEDWFHFRHGRFVKSTRKELCKLRGFRLEPIREATDADVLFFRRAIGEPWSWKRNCLTVVTRNLKDKTMIQNIQPQIEVASGAVLMSTPVWVVVLQDLSVIASTVAAVAGAVIGMHGVWRIWKKRRK